MTAVEKMALKIARQQEKKQKKENEKREQLAAGFAFVKPVSASAKKIIQQLEAMMIDGDAKIDNANNVFMRLLLSRLEQIKYQSLTTTSKTAI